MSIHRTRRAVPVLTMAVLALLVAACAAPTPIAVSTAAGLSRETPEKTYEYFKTMARNNQWANEWGVFSPNFKRMINQEAGRNVDVGDYSTARKTIATNNQADMQMLLNSTLSGPAQFLGPDRARITVSAGGRSVSPTMVRMTKWEMRIRGEDSPAEGVVSSPGQAITVNTDGSITVRVQTDPGVAAALRTIPRDQIEGFALKSEWFVDDFGGLIGQVGGGASQPAAQPGSYAPAGAGSPGAPMPSPTMATGGIE